MRAEHFVKLYAYGTLAWLVYALMDVIVRLARHV